METKNNNIIEIQSKDKYKRFLVNTGLITEKNTIEEIIKTKAQYFLKKEDILIIAESPLSITQGRAIHVDNIKVGFLASFLWRFVSKVPYGIGLRSPTSMQCAIEEAGGCRILTAAIIGGFCKIFRVKGVFYRIAGKQAATIDAAFTTPVEPFNKCVIKGPLNPDKVSCELSEKFNIEVAVMDINDIGGSWVLGASENINREKISEIMKDNPMGQGAEMTPLCILRKDENK